MTENLIYAVGDIHGRLDLLEAALMRIETDMRDRRGKVIFLGDYVDRGPESCGVIELLIKARTAGAVCLKGNHEEMMLRACRGDNDAATRWVFHGGDATLISYGASGRVDETMRRVPQAHLNWLESLPTLAADDHRVYVHAGLMPNVPINEQEDESLLWIKEKFLRASKRAFRDVDHIVHGHTPYWAAKPNADEPELLAHRTNLDTGAFLTGVLSVGVFDAGLAGGPIRVLRITKPAV